MTSIQYLDHIIVIFKEDINIKNEDIKTNIDDLDAANDIYNYIKEFLLQDLDKIQIDALNTTPETIKHGHFRNSVLDIINNQELPKKYLSKFNKDQNGDYYFIFYSRKYQTPLLVVFSHINKSFMARQIFAKVNNMHIPALELAFIDNNLNSFNLQTIKAVLTHKNTIIHEITHVLDAIKSDGKIGNEFKMSYYTRPSEIHAITQQILLWIQTYFDSWKDFDERIGEVSPNNIRKLVEYLLDSDEIRNDDDFYSEKDYYRFSLKNNFKKLSSKAKNKIYSKVAEYLQYNREQNENIKESFEVPIFIDSWV